MWCANGWGGIKGDVGVIAIEVVRVMSCDCGSELMLLYSYSLLDDEELLCIYRSGGNERRGKRWC